MNVLVIAAHPDDETIGGGGTFCKHTARGDRVTAVFLTSGELGLKQLPRETAWQVRESEAKRAAAILGIIHLEFFHLPDWTLRDHIHRGARLLRTVLQRETPQMVYLPHPCDGHPDHQAALPMLRTAVREGRLPKPELRGYEVWTPLPEHDHVEDITDVMPRKLRALRAHRSQLEEFDYVRAVRGLNEFRGELAGKSQYAEVFQTLKWKT